MPANSENKFEIFGDYVLLKLLAAGGMAEVFLARPRNPNANGRIVIIKRILKQIANDPVFIKMFRSEIRVTLGFNHPNTIQLHDFGEFDYQPYIVMEYIEGKSLKEIMNKFGEKAEPIPVPTVLGLISQAASGLSYAHTYENTATGESVQAIHRDISPHNLLVSYDGNLKVIDFGVAKAKNQLNETRAGQIKGKAGYLSPEQLGEEALDGRSDVFSLGIVAWELLTNQRLFQRSGDTEMKIMERIQNCEKYIIPPSTFNKEVPPEVDEVILRALQKNRDERFLSAAAFQTELRTVMRKCYPYYSYSDTSQIMRALFEVDMAFERMVLREANDAAQEILVAEQEEKTRVAQAQAQGGVFSSLLKGFRKPTHLPDAVELRMNKLESALKQKAGFRHAFMLVFYVVSIIGIKLDEKYSLLDRFFLPAQADTIVAEISKRQELQRTKDVVVRQSQLEAPAEVESNEEVGTSAETLAEEPAVALRPVARPVVKARPLVRYPQRLTASAKNVGKAPVANRAPASTRVPVSRAPASKLAAKGKGHVPAPTVKSRLIDKKKIGHSVH